ncbi:hypothetical protein NPS01_24930 [Nocardioides psychrotolerans]|uniref:Uncharacterized protein n=1 Tax=Nocardioides psychrotolerans TaxID=1005945 RepID=A0A1I3L2Y7_9ACTN|nr:hypothetical protein [Nocardioides psychrotolerans]GEP38830.1 hypothetical protein NPS01_24930 [Nocardioides psychrotolerans]SFI79093.1 hypothetical protein SAMN05216561_1139 [Nocardioides psychrotolerans]
MSVTPQNNSASPFQYVPVPNEHVPAVLAFIAERLAPQGSTASTVDSVRTVDPTPPDLSADAPRDDWTDEKLIDFLKMGTKSSKTVIQMLDHLSANPGKDAALSTRELADALGVSYSVMKNVPTQMGRSLGARFPGCSAPYWGLWGTAHFNPSRSNEMYFTVTPERAEQWKRLRG